MSLFDNIYENFKATADVVAKKTEHTVEVSKLKLEIAKIKADIDKKYCELGELVYKACKGNEECKDSSTQIILTIDALYKKVKEHLSELDMLENAVTCKECGKRNSKDSRYCSQCGEKLGE